MNSTITDILYRETFNVSRCFMSHCLKFHSILEVLRHDVTLLEIPLSEVLRHDVMARAAFINQKVEIFCSPIGLFQHAVKYTQRFNNGKVHLIMCTSENCSQYTF